MLQFKIMNFILCSNSRLSRYEFKIPQVKRMNGSRLVGNVPRKMTRVENKGADNRMGKCKVGN